MDEDRKKKGEKVEREETRTQAVTNDLQPRADIVGFSQTEKVLDGQSSVSGNE